MIRQNRFAKVKIALLLCFLNISFANAQGYQTHDEKEAQRIETEEFGVTKGSRPPKIEREVEKTSKVATTSEGINLIEAEDFQVKLMKTSRSKRVLLLAESVEQQPKPGKILVLKQGDQDIAAVRVLKNYKGKFAAKIVLPFTPPAVGTSYRALKKISDKMVEMIRERERMYGDLDNGKSDDELSREVSPSDAELDKGIPLPGPEASPKPKPAPLKGKKGEKIEPLFDSEGNDLQMQDIEVQDEDEPFEELSAQSANAIEPLNHILSVQYSSIRGVTKENGIKQYNAIGGRYGYNIARKILFRKPSLQDMLTFELGAFYYSIVGFENTADEYTLLPVILTARYNLILSENITLFGYAGVNRSFVISSTEAVLTPAAKLLDFTALAAGGGILFKLGPAWAVRADVGLDMFAVGAALKF